MAYITKRVERYLQRRPHTEKEIREYLGMRLKMKDDELEQLLGLIDDMGFIDDNRFANWWLEQRKSQGRYGQRRIASELAQKGVDKSIVDELVKQGDMGDDLNVDELQTMLQREISTRGIDVNDYKSKQKLIRKYMGRGFTIGQILKSIAEIEVNGL